MNKLDIMWDYDAGKNRFGLNRYILTVSDAQGETLKTRRAWGLFNVRVAIDRMSKKYNIGKVNDRGFEYFVNVD